jgi:diphosphomevalonate decarboxylase
MNKQRQQQDFVNQVIGFHIENSSRLTTLKESGHGLAPINIALSKYWGKRDETLNLPMNGSISISLPGLGTETTIKISQAEQDNVTLNGELVAPSNPFAQRLSHFLNHFRAPNVYFDVVTVNTVPTAAGLASSASGYAALVLALNDLFDWNLAPQQLSLLARLGSGSASRSLFSGFSIWHKGQQADGMDSFAEAIESPWPSLCVGLVKVNTTQKPISSTLGMQNTVHNCDLYQAWPKQAEKDMAKVLKAIQQQDFNLLGQTAEHNALSMHATMMATWPPIVYWQPESVAAMQTVWQLRAQGVAIYFTMDAGPNLKLLFPETEKPAVKQAFPELVIIEPFKQSI